MDEFLGFVTFTQEGFAVIGKGQRYQASASYPAGDATHDNAVFEGLVKGRARQSVQFISVRARQRFQPAAIMKYGSSRVTRDKVIPTAVHQGIEDVNLHFSTPTNNLVLLELWIGPTWAVF
jgi:hypothetical protein